MLPEAEAALEEATASFLRLEDSPSYFMTLVYRGFLAFERGDMNSAADYYQKALTIQQQLAPDSLQVATSICNLGIVARGRGDLGLRARRERRPGDRVGFAEPMAYGLGVAGGPAARMP